jgi:hypothetical protein
VDLLVLIHFGFILFVFLGGLLVWRWPRVMWLHLPAMAWGAAIEFVGFICPLTPLENRLRMAAGADVYAGGFVERYIMPVVYPEGLDRSTQLVLGALVIAMNLVIYGIFVVRHKRRRASDSPAIDQRSDDR